MLKSLKEKLLKTNYFIENDFLNKYCQLMFENINTSRIKYKTERHHFIPLSYYSILHQEKNRKLLNMYSKEAKNLIINLSHFNHLLAHYYLCLCSKNTLREKLCVAFNQMTYCNWDCLQLSEQEMILKLENVAVLREEFAKITSKNQLGIPESMESNKKRSMHLLGKNTGPKSVEHKKALSEAAKHRKFNSTSGRISIYNKDLNKKKYIYPEELDFYISKGWIKGGIPQTEEIKRLIGENSKKCLTGTRRSEEAKRKTSETLKKLSRDLNSSYYKKVRRKEADKDNE